jgi:S-adenosylmethionine:tRNA ribosyltransferase-isomerase
LGRRAAGGKRHEIARRVRFPRLDPPKPLVDALPTARHEVDEHRQVVDARAPLREQLLLHALETSIRLVDEAFDLGERPRHRDDLSSDAFLHGSFHAVGKARLEGVGGSCQRLDLGPRPHERGLQLCRLESPVSCLGDTLPGSLQRGVIHDAQGYSGRRMRSSELDYQLPQELVAQRPPERRDDSRLLVYERSTGEIRHCVFGELPDEVTGLLTVINDSRVVPARLRLRRASGGAVEVLLLEPRGDGVWEALARPSRRLRVGERLGQLELGEQLGGGRWLVHLDGEPHGDLPLPPYIHERLDDPARYQTVYADEAGSAAAPTAGLHFTPELLARLDLERVTLHVGLDTFRPLTVKRLSDHVIHGERYAISGAAWERIRDADRVLAVGTTTTRVLETVAHGGELEGRTELFIAPGFPFRRVDALLTNFHLPRSTLLALVMAFVGVDETRRIYEIAIAERYRFYSFGDAMLVR